MSEFVLLEDIEKKSVRYQHIHKLVLKFTIRVLAISLFETVFFWAFVSGSEDTTLITLIDTYTNVFFAECATLTQPEKQSLKVLFNLFVNQTSVNALGNAAFLSRHSNNARLFLMSWMYMLGLLLLCACLAIVGYLKRYKQRWRKIALENLLLMMCLGMYEWMYFSTVIFSYQAVSVPELDQMVANQLEAQC